MTSAQLHRSSRRLNQRLFSSLLTTLMLVALSVPAFAECACCEDMMMPSVPSAIEESSASCHVSEPEVEASTACHEEEATEPIRHPAADVIAGCQFKCAETIAVLGLATEEFVSTSNPVKVNAPVLNTIFRLLDNEETDTGSVAYESLPNLIALRTQQYRSIQPSRI